MSDDVERPLPLTPYRTSADGFVCPECKRDSGWHLMTCSRLKREHHIARWFIDLTLQQWLSVQAWLELEHGKQEAPPDNVVPLVQR